MEKAKRQAEANGDILNVDKNATMGQPPPAAPPTKSQTVAAILHSKQEQIASNPKYKDHIAMIAELFTETIQNTILSEAQDQEALRQATNAAAAMPAAEPSMATAAASTTAMDVNLEKRELKQAEEEAANKLRKKA